MGTELPKSIVTKGLMVLITHSFIEALLHDQIGPNRQIVSNTVYKVNLSLCALCPVQFMLCVLLARPALQSHPPREETVGPESCSAGRCITNIRICASAGVSAAYRRHTRATG
jgi:hypothetical protein